MVHDPKIKIYTVYKKDCEFNTLPQLPNDNIVYEDYVNGGMYSLSLLYNKAIDSCVEGTDSWFDYIIFRHDDLYIEDNNIVGKIDKALNDDSPYSICGVAGNRKCRIIDKNLWHLMGDNNSMSGAVAHTIGDNNIERFVTNFGVTPKRCILIDGCFFAINTRDIKKAGVRFDENNPSKFHFYDLNFCLDAHKAGLQITTYPIWVVHKSHGLSYVNNVEWSKGNEYFKNKWRNKL